MQKLDDDLKCGSQRLNFRCILPERIQNQKLIAEIQLLEAELAFKERELAIREKVADNEIAKSKKIDTDRKIDPLTLAIAGGIITLITQIVVSSFQQSWDRQKSEIQSTETNRIEEKRIAGNKELEQIKQQGTFVLEAIKTQGDIAKAIGNLRLLSSLELIPVTEDKLDDIVNPEGKAPLDFGLPAPPNQSAEQPKLELNLQGGYLAIPGQVLSVFDGELLTFRPNDRQAVELLPGGSPRAIADGAFHLRLAGIDAPTRSTRICGKGVQQKWGDEAAEFASKFVFLGELGKQQEATEEVILYARSVDRFGRLVGIIVRAGDLDTAPRLGIVPPTEAIEKASLQYGMISKGLAARTLSFDATESSLFGLLLQAERRAFESSPRTGMWADYSNAPIELRGKETLLSGMIHPWLYSFICPPVESLSAPDAILRRLRTGSNFVHTETGKQLTFGDIFVVKNETLSMTIPPVFLERAPPRPARLAAE